MAGKQQRHRKPDPAGTPAAAVRKVSPSAGSGSGRPGAARGATAVRRKPGKSIVSRKRVPWGLIVASAVVFLFAIGVVAFAVTRHKSSSSASTSSTASATADGSDRYHLPEVAAAKAISGVIFKVEPNHDHVTAPVSYDTTPPIGGNHSQVWGDCTGTVYPAAIANENAVHDLEHGAVWITYRPGLPQNEVSTLASLVTGQDHLLMSPYPGLRAPISLQAWGYQLTVPSASDPRIAEFISLFRASNATTPETDQNGAAISCAEPSFKLKPSTFGHPIFTA